MEMYKRIIKKICCCCRKRKQKTCNKEMLLKKSSKSLLQVLNEIFAVVIFSYLTYIEVNQMRLVCKDFNRIVTTYEKGFVLRKIWKNRHKNVLKNILTGMDWLECNQRKSICDRAKRLKKLFKIGNTAKIFINGQDVRLFAPKKFNMFIEKQILDLLRNAINIINKNCKGKKNFDRNQLLQKWKKLIMQMEEERSRKKNKQKEKQSKINFNGNKKKSKYPLLYTRATIDYKSIFLICAKCSSHLFMRLLQDKNIKKYCLENPEEKTNLYELICKTYIAEELKSKVKSFLANLTTTAKLRNLL
jgi:hypothetical protein